MAKGKEDIQAGSAFVTLFTKDGPLKNGLKAAQARLQVFGKSVALAGGYIATAGLGLLAPLTAAVKQFTDFGSMLTDMGQRTGVAASKLAEYGFAADQTGASLEDVEAALRHMAKVGLDVNRFDEIAAEIAAIPDPTMRAARAMQVWGKAGTAILPMAGNLKSLREEAQKLGIAFTPEQIAMADELGDAFGRVKTAIFAAAFQAGVALAPTFIAILDSAKGIAVAFGEMVKKNPGLVKAVAAIGAVLLAVGTLLGAGGAGLATIGAVVGGIAAIATPITLIVLLLGAMAVAVAGLTVGFLLFYKDGQAAFLRLVTVIKGAMTGVRDLGKTIKDTFGGIADALAAGDIDLAWKIMVKGLEITWLQFIQRILASYATLASAISPGGATIVGGVATAYGAPDVAKAQKELAALRAQAAAAAAKAGNRGQYGGSSYGAPLMGAKTIGYSARSALMGNQIIGGGKNGALDTLKKILFAEEKSREHLERIAARVGPARVK